ncbi:MAG: YhgE/Pip domain-containing protein [Propionibacteriaceae bacterium]|jgi:putative membrane protein|nr:YhgE/Pip domain-containing protein [Propionibacteriaceae bacterium]
MRKLTRQIITFVTLAMVPLLIAGGFVWAGWNNVDRLKELKAAIVNEDEPVTVQGQYTPLGRQLSAALIDSEREQNLDWEFALRADAEEGLASGEYAAMVIIPTTFSANATSFGGSVEDVKQAAIQIETSPVSGLAESDVARVIANAARTSINDMLTSTYLDNIYLGFNQMGEQYVQLADASKKLADGADQLADGVGQAYTGVDALYKGSKQLSDGLGTMATETKDMPKQVKQLSDGLTALSKGLAKMKKETKELPAGTQTLADGAKTLSDGIKQYSDGVNQLLDMIVPLMETLDKYSDEVGTIAKYGKEITQGITDLYNAMKNMDQAYIQAAMEAAKEAVDKLPCPDAIKDAGQCDAFYKALEDGAMDAVEVGLTQGASVIVEIMESTDAQGNSVLSIVKQINTLCAELEAGAPNIGTQVAQLKQLQAAGPQLASGASELATGTQTLATNMSALTKGISDSASGAKQLADGGKQLSSGTKQLVDGIAQSATGSKQLTAGIKQLGEGLGQAGDGADQLADGLGQMADGIDKGKDQIPSYTEADRERLSTAVSEPISTSGDDALTNANLGWGTVLFMLSLWLGAMATYSVFPAVRKTVLTSSKSTKRIVAEEMVPGLIVVAAQSVLVTVLAELALGLSAAKAAATVAVLLLAGLTFVLLNHALIAWLGRPGRFISVGVAVLSGVFSITDAVPEFFNFMRGFLPLTPAIDALRGIVTGATGVPSQIMELLAWAAVAAIASVIAVTRARSVPLSVLVAEPVAV